ncbi:hypothetical protein GCM10020254_07780 [Streptomyces goshikiensis]
MGSSTKSSYRADLWKSLKAHTDDVAFVGSQQSGSLPDDDHEGYPGRRIDQVASIAHCTVARTKPNVVTLHIGTNDMNQSHDLAGAPKRMGALIDQVLADSPGATVLVATLIPSVKAGMQPKIDAFNAALPGVVAQRAGQGKHVLLVGMGAVTPPTWPRPPTRTTRATARWPRPTSPGSPPPTSADGSVPRTAPRATRRPAAWTPPPIWARAGSRWGGHRPRDGRSGGPDRPGAAQR